MKHSLGPLSIFGAATRSLKATNTLCRLTYIFCTAAILLLSTANTTAQELIDLQKNTPSWVSVLGGNAVCQPVRTSYGYAVIGEGRMVSAFSPNGAILWQKTFTSRPKPFISAGISDMLFIVTKDTRVNMLNAGGDTVWTKDTGFSVTESPFPGRDGRVFVRGKNTLACYSAKGSERWKVELSKQNTSIPLAELNEGSLLVFTETSADGKSVARTVTPFGKMSEEIVFAGKVVYAKSCSSGVLLSFTDGSTGLVAENKSGAFSVWAHNGTDWGFSESALISTEALADGKAAFFSGGKIVVADCKTGAALETFRDFGIQSKDAVYFGGTIQGIVVADRRLAVCLKEDAGGPQNASGTQNVSGATQNDGGSHIIWKASTALKKKWLYTFPTDSGYLAFCSSSWGIDAYRVKQNLGQQAKKTSFVSKKAESYKTFYPQIQIQSSSLMGPAISPAEAKKILHSLTKGPSGEKEAQELSLITSELSELTSGWMQTQWDYTSEKNYFQLNSAYCETVTSLAANSGTALFSKNLALLLKRTNDVSMLTAIVKACEAQRFDPEGDMILTLEYILRRVANPKDETLCTAICDASLSICTFMGSPFLWTHGREIISYMLYPQFNSKTQEYARKALEKIMQNGQ